MLYVGRNCTLTAVIFEITVSGKQQQLQKKHHSNMECLPPPLLLLETPGNNVKYGCLCDIFVGNKVAQTISPPRGMILIFWSNGWSDTMWVRSCNCSETTKALSSD